MIIKDLHDMRCFNGISDAYSVHCSAEIHDGNVIKTEFSDDGFCAVREKFTVSGEYKKIDDVYTRKDTFINTSDEDIHINDYKYRFTFPGDEYEVYTKYNNWSDECRGEWTKLVTETSVLSKSPRTCDTHVPMLAIFNKQTKKGFVFYLYTNCSWKISARKQSPNNPYIFTMVEISPLDDALDIVVKQGESFEMPKVLFYEFDNKENFDSHKLHKYLLKTHPRKKLPVIYNTWLAFFDQIDFDKIYAQIEKASYIGCDYFTLDAGWFGNGESWSHCVGDWVENKTGAYMGNMKLVSDKVHQNGMKFGLWIEPERAVKTAEIVKNHPEYFFDDNGFSCFLDFSNDEARKYITDVTINLAKQYNIDFFKFDFNDSITYDKKRKAFFDYHKGLSQYIEDVRRALPNIYIEGCASGGMVTNIYNMTIYDSVWMTDNQSVYSGVRIFKDSINHVLPCFMEKWGAFLSVEGKFPQYGIKNRVTRDFSANDGTWTGITNFYDGWLDGFFAGSPIGITTDLTEISDQLLEKLKAVIEKFKKDELFWRNATCRIVAETQKLLVLQYENDKEIRLVVYTGKPVTQSELVVYPILDGKEFTYDGKNYNGDGIKIPNPTERNSYILTLERK